MEIVPLESKPINDTWVNRIFTLTAIKLLKYHRPHRSNVLLLSRKLCVKYGQFQYLSEAATIQFISQNTSIPVPKIYCSFSTRKRSYIMMERVDGEMLGRGWSARSKESKAKIFRQLKSMIAEMRSIHPPENMGVANVDGGMLSDCRLPPPTRFGPFKDIPEFHKHLRQGWEADPQHYPEVSELISLHEGTWPLCFTHADLSSLNILIRADEVVAIVDWETAGWYPSYWEYTTACNVNPQNEFWREEIDNFLEPMPKEVAMEEIRLKYFGDW